MPIFKTIKSELARLDTSPAKLRSFGFTIGGALAVIALLLLVLKGVAATWWWIFAVLIACAGFFAPKILRPLYVPWMGVAIVIGTFVFRFLLLLSFYLIITPIGILMRLFRGDAMDRTIDPHTKSYWHRREAEDARTDATKLF